MPKSIDDFVDQYSEQDSYDRGPQLRGLSIKIGLEAMILLEALADHTGKKKTPLMGELAESVIHEVFDRLQDEMDPDLVENVGRRVSEEVQNV